MSAQASRNPTGDAHSHRRRRRRSRPSRVPSTHAKHFFPTMSAMSAHFTAAPAAARPTAAIRRASRRSAARVVRRGVVAEAIKEPSTLNTTKSDQVRTTSRPLLMCAFERGPGSRRSRLVATGPRGARPRRNRRSGVPGFAIGIRYDIRKPTTEVHDRDASARVAIQLATPRSSSHQRVTARGSRPVSRRSQARTPPPSSDRSPPFLRRFPSVALQRSFLL